MDDLAPSSMNIGPPLLALLCDLGFGGDLGFGRPFQGFLPGQGFVMCTHGIDGCIYRLAGLITAKVLNHANPMEAHHMAAKYARFAIFDLDRRKETFYTPLFQIGTSH
jgi:hypothetical protein